MSILTDTDIKRLLDKGTFAITPFNEERLTPIGYNLSIGNFYISKRKLQRFNLKLGEEFTVKPGEVVAIRSLETVELPADRSISGLLKAKIKMITAGFAQISTTIDSDHNGPLIIQVQNISSYNATLVQGRPFCTMVLFTNNTPSTKHANNPYNEEEIIDNLIDTWANQRRSAGPKLWQLTRPFGPILFVISSGIIALAYFGSTPAFGGVMAAIAAIGMLFERILNSSRRE